MIQNWVKKGLIYSSNSYSALPVVIPINHHMIRIIFSSRDSKNQSIPFSLDYNLSLGTVQKVAKIKINLGSSGSFDENGIMPTSYVAKDKTIYLYYIGWNVGGNVPFRNAIGLMISDDYGNTFNKYSDGPILDRSIFDKCFVASNSVILDDGIYKMYYLSCDKWIKENGTLKHYYNIKYSESLDAITWNRTGKIAVNFKNEYEYAISVPRVLVEKNIYKMWYSYRGSKFNNSYRIGYAESVNGIDWIRKDEMVGLDVSRSGWDSEMVCYPYVFNHHGERYMLYNGNGYGKTGIGLATLEEGQDL